MENKKPLYQPWNEEEFQSDVFVRGMTALQRWMYRSLLQASFFHTTRPFLPNDDRILWVLAGCENRQQWLDNKSEILERFTAVDGQPNLLENKRVTADWNKLRDFRDKMSELGSKGGQAAAEKRAPAVLFSGGQAHATAHAQASEVKVSEGKVSEEKKSEGNNTTAEEEVLQPSAKGKGDWSNIRRPYRHVFGKKPDSARFKHKYEQACLEYGEDVVIACFESWAATAGDLIKGFDNPLYSFFKKLPDLAADEVACKQEDKELAAQAEKEKQQRAQDEAAMEESIRRQKAADWLRMNETPPPENGASVLEYLADLESK